MEYWESEWLLEHPPKASFQYRKWGSQTPRRSCRPSLLRCAVDLCTGKWMRSGDAASRGLREQLTTEQSNVAVISALFLRMTMSMQMAVNPNGQQWTNDDWAKGTFCAIMSISCTILTMSTLLAVFTVVTINECTDHLELVRFDGIMGGLMHLPLLLFLLGMCSYGITGWCFWWYLTLSSNSFVCIISVAYGLSVAVLLPGLFKTLQHLYEARNERCGAASIEADQVRLALQSCLQTDEHAGELVSLETFQEYVCEVCKVETISPLTMLKMKVVLEEWQEDVLVLEEKEQEAQEERKA